MAQSGLGATTATFNLVPGLTRDRTNLVRAKAGIVSNSELGTIPGQARDKVWNGPGS
jgi:hypothetical protein